MARFRCYIERDLVRHYVHGLEFDRYSDPSSVSVLTSTLKLDFDVSPDRMYVSQKLAPQDTTQQPDRSVFAENISSMPVRSFPELTHTDSAPVKSSSPAFPSHEYRFPKIKLSLRTLSSIILMPRSALKVCRPSLKFMRLRKVVWTILLGLVSIPLM